MWDSDILTGGKVAAEKTSWDGQQNVFDKSMLIKIPQFDNNDSQ